MSEVLRLRREAVEWRITDDGILVEDRRTSRHLTVNATGASMWHRLLDGATLEELTVEVTGRFDVETERARQDALGFLHELAERGLLEGDLPHRG